MAESEYDDTDMTLDEFEDRMAAGLPATVGVTRKGSGAPAMPMAVFVGESGNNAGDKGAATLNVSSIGQFALVVGPENALATAG